MALGGFGPQAPELSEVDLPANLLRSARSILARHAGCHCNLCELAASIELRYTGMTYER